MTQTTYIWVVNSLLVVLDTLTAFRHHGPWRMNRNDGRRPLHAGGAVALNPELASSGEDGWGVVSEDEEHRGDGLDLETWNIEQGLRNIRRRRRVFGLALVGILPYFFVTGSLMPKMGLPAYAPLAPYAAFIIYAYARLVVAECPSCGNRFFSRWSSGYNYLSSCCMHCGQML